MELTLREGIRKVLFDEMGKNQDMFLIGESMHYTGSLFSKVINEDFYRTYGKGRVLDCPVAEDAIIGMAFGGALAGMTAVAEIWAADFLLCVANELVNTIAKWRYQHRYPNPIHLVVRAPMGLFVNGGGGPEHVQCTESWLHNSPGLTIVAPSSVEDAVGLLRTSLRCGDPVVFLEHRQVYDVKADIDYASGEEIPIGKGRVVREGKDITIVAWAMMQRRAQKAAELLAAKGISAEIIDPRTIKPMDYEMIIASAQKTGRLIVAEEAHQTGSIAGEIITRVREAGVDGDFQRMTMPDIPYHYVIEYEASEIPTAEEIAERAEKMVRG